MEDLGRVLVRAGLPGRGATLIEFARRAGLRLGLTSMDAPALANVLDVAREALGPDGWKEVEATVASLDLDDAVALALDESVDHDLPPASR